MRRYSRVMLGVLMIIGLVLTIGSSCVSAASPSDPLFPWYQQMFTGSYQKLGKQDSVWDAKAVAALDLGARRWSDTTTNRPSRQATIDAAKAAMTGGCQDPVVLFLYGYSMLSETNYNTAESLLDKSLTGLRNGHYPQMMMSFAANELATARHYQGKDEEAKHLAADSVEAFLRAVNNHELQPGMIQMDQIIFRRNLNRIQSLFTDIGISDAQTTRHMRESVLKDPRNRIDPLLLFLRQAVTTAAVLEHREWHEVQDKTRAAFFTGDYNELERIAEDYRSRKSRFRTGQWKLAYFYGALAADCHVNDEEYWTEMFKRLKKWVELKPNSVTARIALGSCYIQYASHARGGGWAKDVTEDQWKLYRERLAEANRVLEPAKKIPKRDPHWYATMLEFARLQSWERADLDALFNEAVNSEPGYYDNYCRKAYYLLPRWLGDEGDWQKFALDASAFSMKKIKEDMYAHIVWGIWQYIDHGFGDFHTSHFLTENEIPWERFKQGFEDMEKHYPTSLWNRNIYCWFAVLADDHQTAKELFKKLGDDWDVWIWKSEANYNRCKNWAEVGHD